ncbi:MAG: hypothetical protein EOO91_14925, partial [Pedobacter sp.]
MKRLYKYSLGLVVVLSLSTTSCKKYLDEVNPGATTVETAYGNKSGFEGLINTIYVDNYFLYGKVDFIGWRAWAYFNLVEQFGPVYLTTKSAATEGTNITPKRSTEKEIYDAIIADLKFATEKLPLTQGALRGRIAKKAAYALLAKVYLQRTRLGEAAQYGALALATAEELINNQAKYNCALYTSDATRSGFAKAFDLKN